jgi:hypothetical protein
MEKHRLRAALRLGADISPLNRDFGKAQRMNNIGNPRGNLSCINNWVTTDCRMYRLKTAQDEPKNSPLKIAASYLILQ